MAIGKKFLLVIIILLVRIFSPHLSRAAVDGSPHDLISQHYVLKGDGRSPGNCFFCHLPFREGNRIHGYDTPPSISYYSRTGLVCFSCHDGTTIVSQNVDASRNAFHPDAHPLVWGKLPLPKQETGQRVMPIEPTKLECVTCHDPHDNEIRPFLRVNVGQLCSICHKRKENIGYGINNLSGNHPIHETIEDDSGKKTLIEPVPEFLVPFPLEYPQSGGRDIDGVHWQKGGHLHGGDAGTLECFTCHNVHGSEGKTPLEKLLTIPPVRKVADVFCEGCHRGKRGDTNKSPYFPNPGGTSIGRTYHPCDDDMSNGSRWLLEIRQNVPWPFGKAVPEAIVCTTCHVAHGGMERTPALRRPFLAATFCEECHLPELMPNHHPNGDRSESERLCQPIPDDFNIGLSEEGVIYCSSCHVAHNAGLGKDERNYIPILKYSLVKDDLCLACHPLDNITCREEDKGKASHFMGDPTSAETYDDPNPPLKKTPWPGTRLSSRYGGNSLTEIGCLSCHTFQQNDRPGMSGPLPYYLYANAGDKYEWEDNLDIYLCTGCHGESPGTMGEGKSHPLMKAEISELDQDIISPASSTVNGHLNCDSCHRSHGAVTGGGYYILKTVYSDNEDPYLIKPAIDYTSLCHLCHDPEKY